MRKFSIFTKLFLSIFLVAFICLVTFGTLVYYTQKEALIKRTSEQLKSVNILKKRSIEKRLTEDEKFIWHFIRQVMLYNNSKTFSAEKEFVRHKEFLRDFCKDFGHVDVMLLNEHEQAVDSLFVGDNYERSLGPNKFTFVRVFLVDNSQYRVALVSSTAYLQKLLFENTGMGNTGESYLVGKDNRMVSISRFFPEKPSRSIIVNTPSVNMAQKGLTGTSLIKDYRNINVLSAFVPIFYKNLHWVLISEIDNSEAMAPVLKLQAILILVIILILLFTFLAAFYLSKLIVSPIRKVSSGMLSLAEGNIPTKSEPPFFDNEEGKMKLALNSLIGSFESITNFAGEIGSGNLSANFSPIGEKDELSKSLVNMRDQLKDYQQKEKTLRRQKTLALIEGQENERRRIAMDLHDGLGQWLTGIKLKIAVISIPENQREELKSMLFETINETRRITNNLMPNTLIDFGLNSALKQMVSSIQKDSQIRIEYDYKFPQNDLSLPFEITLTLYRIAQEALNNILKHANAQNILIFIEQAEDFILLNIEDDGIGIPEKYSAGLGLSNMEERAKLIEGTFSFKNKDKGTRLTVTVPF